MKRIFLLLQIFAAAGAVHADEYVVRAPYAFHRLTAEFSVQRSLPRTGLQVAELTRAQAEHLAQQGFLVERNHRIQQFRLPQAVRAAGTSWHLGAVHAPQAQALPNGSGEGQTVCVVDSGLDAGNAEFQGVPVSGVNLLDKNNPTDLNDSNFHGTAVASLIAGQTVGVAPRASLYVAKVFSADGSADVATVTEGIVSCIGNAQVINLSWGSFQDSMVIQDAIDQALAAGITVVAAAGNEAQDVAFPARYAPVIAVGAVSEYLTLSPFSARGPEIDFVAPGGNVTVFAMNSYKPMDGTSFSAAITSGVEAVRRSRGTAALKALDLGLPANEQGQGLIDAYSTAQ